MMNRFSLVLVCSLALILGACVSLHTLDSQKVMATKTKGLRQVSENVFSGGQPTEEQLKALSEAGVKNIVS